MSNAVFLRLACFMDLFYHAGNTMTRPRLSLFVLLLAVFLPFSVSAVTRTPTKAVPVQRDPYEGEEHVADFNVTAALTSDRELTISEQINYDFASAYRHGIYRDIPVRYDRDGGTYNLRLDVTHITRDGNDEQYKDEIQDGVESIRIGDPDVGDLTGKHAYEIDYHTNRAINFFPDHDELYWNVNGNGWEYPIERASFTLTVPAGVELSSVSSTCFTGAYGSPEHDCTVTSGEGKIVFKATRVLEANEGLTIVVGFPKGIIRQPTLEEKALMLVSDNWELGMPLATLLILGAIWFLKGRDPRKGTVIPEYEPPQKLLPAMVGAIMTNGVVPGRTVTATIIDLARRGYLKINFGTKKGLLSSSQTYTFIKQTGSGYEKLQDYERAIYNGLFDGGDSQTVEDLKKTQFYSNVTTFKKNVQTKVDAMKLFDASPAKVKGFFTTAGIIIGWILVTVAGATFLGLACGVATGMLIMGFGFVMPRRTAAGIRLLADLEGFKWFLSVTEKERLDFHNAPERTPEQFMEFLPYAIVFEVEKKWAAQFADLNMEPPRWAEGSVSNWNTAMFVSNLSSMHTAASSSAYGSPSSAGGGGSGFSGGGSGGGFGGGGGGSW